VIFQSVTPRKPLVKTQRRLRAVMVGHLREEKSPQTLMAAAGLLTHHPDILMDHIGDALDADLGRQAQACAAACPQYRWLGALPHSAARRRIQNAHVLVHASRMEGGAHVLMEAVCSGTPVLASRIAGNIGMLGANYLGYFDHGDAKGLANALLRCRAAQQQPADPFYSQLQAQCAQLAALFAPAHEQAALLHLVRELLP
jgi:glycosyltransferase involved in cell wall biosynthesis